MFTQGKGVDWGCDVVRRQRDELRARACIYVFGSVNLNTKTKPNLPSTTTVTTTVFQPPSKEELLNAVQTCSLAPMEMRK